MAFETTDMTYSISPVGTINAADLIPMDLFPKGSKFFLTDEGIGMKWTPEDYFFRPLFDPVDDYWPKKYKDRHPTTFELLDTE